MSGKDDPFGAGGKTVIRPNPGGGGTRPAARRPAARHPPALAAMAAPAGAGSARRISAAPAAGRLPAAARRYPQQGYPQRPQPGGYNPRVNAPQQGFGRGVGGMPSQEDDWYAAPTTSSSRSSRNTGSSSRRLPEQPKIPLAVALNARDSGQIPAANPLTAAAAPLLILLGRLRLMIIDIEARPLMEHVANEITAFEQQVRSQAGVDQHDVDVGKYVLCGTADDIVQNLPGTDQGVWLQYSMLAQFFRVRTSGVGFFEELAKVLQATRRRATTCSS